MAGVGSKCTRRKQANPRRKNFELEEPMPEDTDLNVEIAELAAPAESLNVESKDLIKIKSSNRSNGKKELKLPHCQPIESTIMSSSLPDSNTKENKSHNEQNSAKESSNMEPSAKEVLCNTSICNGFVKVNNEKVSQDNNNDDHNNGEMKQSINGNGTNDSDTEQDDDDDQQTQQKDNETKDDDNKTNDTQSAKQLNLENDEDDKIKEYLQRSDTAVIFPEPVTNELAKSKFEKSNCDLKDGQSLANSNDNNDDDDNGLKTDRNRMPENASSNNGVANTMLTDLLARCPQCGKLFRGPRSTLALQEHITNIHAPTSLQSSFLPASSSSPTNSVASAITQDDPDKPYVCIKCKASFMHKDHLEKHEQLHSTQGQSCQLCNKSFANVYRLQRHMLSHDESQVLRKFKCPECFKAFKFKHHLKEHIRIHSGEKPFACPNCGKRFSHSGSYSSHMTSKKCLVVNLKIRKADQIRSQKSKNNNQTNMNNIVFNSQSPVNNIESLVYNSVNHSANNKLKHSQLLSKEDQFNLANNNNSISILKNEIGNFPPLFPLPSEFSNINSDQTIANYLSSANFPSNLPPAIFSAVAASVRLPPHYLPSSLSNYPDVANAILRSNLDKNEKNIEFFKEKYHEFNKTELFKKINTKSFFDSSDLKTMQNILQMVDGNAVINKESQSNSIQNGSINEIRSSNPSPSLTFSASSFHLPQITPIDSPDDNKKSFSDGTKCRFCGDHFENKIDLHKHENFHCKSNQIISSKVSNEISNKDLYYNENYGKHHNQIGESDDESQRDSFSYDDEMNDGKKVRVRSVLNEETVKIFRAQYEINPRPKKHDILRLSEEVKYPPRVVQVWFQNMRARDRRLGRPIPSSNQTNEISLPESNGQKVFNELSPSFHSVVHYTIPQPLLPPISIPHYKPATQCSHSYSSSVITPSHYTCNGMELFTPTKNNEQKPSLVSKELSPSFTNKTDTNGCAEEPLDLSVKSKIKSPDVNHNVSTEFEILNLSKKSNDNSNDNLLSGNVSLAILQQQQRQETLEQTSIVRSILQSKTIEMDTSPSQFNSSNNDMKKSPNYESILNKDENQIKPNLKRPHSITDELGHNSDSTNPSDEFNCSNSPSRSKLSIVPSPKIWRANVDNVISRDNQTPPDVNLQGDGSGLFTCDQCDKTFSKQSSLARHKYEHSGQRPHKCDVCSKAFKHKHHLTEHKRLHSGEKPFQCKKCLKRFSHSGSYSQHMNHRYSYCKPYRD